jgi:hypothetical protein
MQEKDGKPNILGALGALSGGLPKKTTSTKYPVVYSSKALNLEFFVRAGELKYKDPKNNKTIPIAKGSDISEDLYDKISATYNEANKEDCKKFFDNQENIGSLTGSAIYQKHSPQPAQSIAIERDLSTSVTNVSSSLDGQSLVEIERNIESLELKRAQIKARESRFSDESEKEECFKSVIKKYSFKILEKDTDALTSGEIGFIISYNPPKISVKRNGKKPIPKDFDLSNPLYEFITLGKAFTAKDKKDFLEYSYENSLLSGEDLKVMASGEIIVDQPLITNNAANNRNSQDIKEMDNNAILRSWNKAIDAKDLRIFTSNDHSAKPARNIDGMSNFIGDMDRWNMPDLNAVKLTLRNAMQENIESASLNDLKNIIEEAKQQQTTLLAANNIKNILKKASNNSFTKSRYAAYNHPEQMTLIEISGVLRNDDDKEVSSKFTKLYNNLQAIESAELAFKILTESTPEQRQYIGRNMPSQPSVVIKQPGELRSRSPSRSSSPTTSSDSGVTNSSEKSSGSTSPINTIQVTRSTISVEDALAMVKSNPRSSSPLKAGTEQEAQKASSLHPTDTVTSSTAKKTRGRRDL